MMKPKPKPHTIAVNIPPYGRMKIVGEKGDDALSVLQRNWPKLWPKVRSSVKSQLKCMCKDYEIPVRFKGMKWMAAAGRLDPDVFMGDKADSFLEIQLEGSPVSEEADPVWDFFIKGTKIVHWQPSY